MPPAETEIFHHYRVLRRDDGSLWGTRPAARWSSHPESAVTYYDCGYVHQRVRKYDQAAKDFNEAIRLDPENPHAYLLRAQVNRSRGRAAAAAQDEAQARRLKAALKPAGG